MAFCLETEIKEKAVNDLIILISKNNKSLALSLRRNYRAIYNTAVIHIQKIGYHDYANEILKRNSEYRDELNKLMGIKKR